MEKVINKLKILKNSDIYYFIWMSNDEIIYTERRFISLDENGTPTNLNIEELLAHKHQCCGLDMENFQVTEETSDLQFTIGIEQAITSLRPGAKFELSNTEVTYWEHELPPPTWSEINLEMIRLRIELEKQISS
jgi:hypothetical protein